MRATGSHYSRGEGAAYVSASNHLLTLTGIPTKTKLYCYLYLPIDVAGLTTLHRSGANLAAHPSRAGVFGAESSNALSCPSFQSWFMGSCVARASWVEISNKHTNSSREKERERVGKVMRGAKPKCWLYHTECKRKSSVYLHRPVN